MTTVTKGNNIKHKCSFCSADYNKTIPEMIDKGQEFNVIYCGQFHNMETIRRGPEWSVVYQHTQD